MLCTIYTFIQFKSFFKWTIFSAKGIIHFHPLQRIIFIFPLLPINRQVWSTKTHSIIPHCSLYLAAPIQVSVLTISTVLVGLSSLFTHIFIADIHVVLIDDDTDDKTKVIDYLLLKKYKKNLKHLKNE